jgi:O-antigen/teichoic acid export membrane protein
MLNKDYLYKLLTNFVKIPISFLLQAILPRILSTSSYGNYDFLIDTANKFISFFETGTSTAFYSKLSQNNKNDALLNFYWKLIAFISCIFVGFVSIVLIGGNSNLFWPGQNPTSILISSFFGVVLLYSNSISKILDASQLTVKAEKFKIVQLIISVFFLCIIYYLLQKISVANFILVQILLTLILIFGNIKILNSAGFKIFPKVILSKIQKKGFKLYFVRYSSPLLVYSLVSLIIGLGDRWILQKFGGSTQQAFFGLAFKVGSFIFIFSSAMMPLLMREMSIFFSEKNIEKISKSFINNTNILFFLTTILAVCISFNAEFVISLLGGEKYKSAYYITAIMVYYPIHQTLGQINGTLYYSTMRTNEYRNIGIIVLPFGLILNFIFMAPREYYGLELGAFGLVLQMIIIQYISVNVMAYKNSKFLKISFFENFLQQNGNLVFSILLGYAIKSLSLCITSNQFLQTLIFCLSYLTIFYFIIQFNHKLFGFSQPISILKLFKTNKLKNES